MARRKQHEASEMPGQHWRKLVQNSRGRKRSMSSVARNRQFWDRLKWVVLIGGVACLLIAAIGLIARVVARPPQIPNIAPSSPLALIEVETNGVLDRAWVEEYVTVPYGRPLLQVDIEELDRQIELYGQVEGAEVRREFPDALLIRVREREPVLRVRTTVGGTEVDMLVADDGEPYVGFNYTVDDLAELPYLAGVRLRKAEAGFRTIENVRVCAPLLRLAREKYPEIYAQWQVVSLEGVSAGEVEPGATIQVQTPRIERILFSPRQFESQLNSLRQTLDFGEARSGRRIRQIDLSDPTEVAVRLARTDRGPRGRF